MRDALYENGKPYVMNEQCISEVRLNWIASTKEMISLSVDLPGDNLCPDNEGL